MLIPKVWTSRVLGQCNVIGWDTRCDTRRLVILKKMKVFDESWNLSVQLVKYGYTMNVSLGDLEVCRMSIKELIVIYILYMVSCLEVTRDPGKAG